MIAIGQKIIQDQEKLEIFTLTLAKIYIFGVSVLNLKTQQYATKMLSNSPRVMKILIRLPCCYYKLPDRQAGFTETIDSRFF